HVRWGDDPDVVQLEHVRQVRQAEPAMQQRRVGEFRLIPGLDQFRSRPGGDPGVGPEVAVRSGRHTGPFLANSVADPPVTRNTTGPSSRSERACAISAAIALAPNTGSSRIPSVRATRAVASS